MLTDIHPKGITLDSGSAFQRELKRDGKDGVIFTSDDEIIQVAVFSPKQVKSAISNNGEYSKDTHLSK